MHDSVMVDILDCVVFFGVLGIVSNFTIVKLLKEIRDNTKNK
jgi:hypothetical protein